MSGEPDALTDFTRYHTEAPFQYSDKLGEGIFLVRGDSFEEFTHHMVEVFGQDGTDARLLGIASKQGSSHVISQAVDNLQNAGVIEPAPVNNSAKQCRHGAMTKRNGTSAKGKAWTAYFCPLEKGNPDQCGAEFV